MTKREICERLLEIWAMETYKRGEAVRYLLLDLAAPEDHFADAGKKVREEEKHTGILVDPSGKNPPRCLKCGKEAQTHNNLFAFGDEWVCCAECGVSFRMKRKIEDGRQEGVKQLYEIAEKVLAKFDFDKAAQYEHRPLFDVWAEANNAVIYSIEGLGPREGEKEVRRDGFIAKATRRRWLDESDAFTGRLGKYCLRIDLTHEATGQHVSCAEKEGEKNL